MPTPNQTFYAEIPRILTEGSKGHREIADELQEKYPECCNDAIRCPHRKDNSKQPEWDHMVRRNEQRLKLKNIIKYNHSNHKWELARPQEVL